MGVHEELSIIVIGVPKLGVPGLLLRHIFLTPYTTAIYTTMPVWRQAKIPAADHKNIIKLS